MSANCTIIVNGKTVFEGEALEMTLAVVVKEPMKADDQQSTADNRNRVGM